MDNELLTWFGNFLNFAIIIYLVRITFSTGCFNYSQIYLTAFGLLVSILIQLRGINEK